MTKTWNREAWSALLTIVITMVLWIVVKFVLSLNLSFFNPISEALDNYQLTDLYFNIHSSARQGEVQTAAASDVVIIDIAGINTRSEISQLLQRVGEAEPRIVALDIIFGKASSINQEENDSLVSVISGLPNLIIATNMVPSSDTAFTAERSFFSDEQWATEAVTNLEYGIVRHFMPLQVFGNDTLYSLSKMIADRSNIIMPATTQPLLIDYTLPQGMILSGKEQWDAGYLKDKVVLVGDRGDLRDQFAVPVTMHGEKRVAGVDIHRQILATAAAGHIFSQTPKALEIAIGILLVFLSTLLSIVIRRRNMQNRKMSDVAIGWLLNLMQLAFIIVSVAVAYCLMWGFHVLFSVKYIIVGFALIEMIEKLKRDIMKWKS